MKLECLDDQLMATAAHRYCLGRSSYIVGSCIDWIRATWAQMEPNTQFVILRDTVEALIDNHAGGDSDMRGWREAAQWMAENMPPARLQAVRQSLEWKSGADVFLPARAQEGPKP